MRWLPNALSCVRIALSASLPFLAKEPILFTAVYVLCGISDALDGLLARRWNVQSALGARLDSLGDFVFFTAAIICVWPLLQGERLLLIMIGVIFVLRMGNLLLTRYKFGQWSGMHTLGNKLAGLLLFLLLPACILIAKIPYWLAIPVCAVALLSALEEMSILIVNTAYDVDQRSLFRKRG